LERLREKWAAELERGGPDFERKIDPRGGCINIVLTAHSLAPCVCFFYYRCTQ